MGNILNTGSFSERKIPELNVHLNRFINKYLKIYSERNSLSNSIIWDEIFMSIDLNNNMFTKIKHLDPALNSILDASFCNCYDTIGPTLTYFNDPICANDPIQILEYWFDHGIFDKLEKLHEKNMDLDFSAIHCHQNSVTKIGSNAFNSSGSDFTRLIIPFKNDESMYVCLSA